MVREWRACSFVCGIDFLRPQDRCAAATAFAAEGSNASRAVCRALTLLQETTRFSRAGHTQREDSRALRAASGSTAGWTVLGPVQPLASSVRNPQNSDKSCVLRVVGAMEVRLSITQTSKRQTLCTTKSQAGHALPIDRFFARLTRRTAASLRRSFLSCNIASSQPRVPAPRASAGNENKKRRTSLFVLVEGCPCSPPLQRSSFHVQVTPS